MANRETGKPAISSAGRTQQTGDQPADRVLEEFDKAYSQYLDAIRTPYREYEEGAQQTYRQYIEDLRSAWNAPDAQRKTEEAYQRYVERLAEVWEMATIGPRLEKAYHVYLAHIKAAFGSMEVDRFEPHHLANVGRSILSAMWYCHATFPTPMGTGQSPIVVKR